MKKITSRTFFFLQDDVFVSFKALLNVLLKLIFSPLDFIDILFHVLYSLSCPHDFLLDFFIFVFQSLCRISENNVFLKLNLRLNLGIVSLEQVNVLAGLLFLLLQLTDFGLKLMLLCHKKVLKTGNGLGFLFQ